MNNTIFFILEKQQKKDKMFQNFLKNSNKKKHYKRLEAKRRSKTKQQNKNNAIIPFGIDKTIEELHYNFNWYIVYLKQYLNDLIIDKNTQETNKIYIKIKGGKK